MKESFGDMGDFLFGSLCGYQGPAMAFTVVAGEVSPLMNPVDSAEAATGNTRLRDGVPVACYWT
jgi:hypothetical protein